MASQIGPRLVLSMLAWSGICASASADPFGQAPTYTSRALSNVPNVAAITRRIWVPGLDEGYVPQGLAVIAGALYVSSYKSADPKQNTGPCRLYRLDTATGATTGQLDLPASCGHAGGIAKGPTPLSLFVADTKTIYEVTISVPAINDIGRVTRSIQLNGTVKGSFAAGTSDALWLGTFSRDPGANLYKFPWSVLAPTISQADAAATVALPLEAQGAAFDSAGQLWITRSTSKYGELVKLDSVTGQPQQRFVMPAGLEDLSFDSGGALWTLSEAGSQRWNNWSTFYPMIIRIDSTRLR
jgi:hypothetical protein